MTHAAAASIIFPAACINSITISRGQAPTKRQSSSHNQIPDSLGTLYGLQSQREKSKVAQLARFHTYSRRPSNTSKVSLVFWFVSFNRQVWNWSMTCWIDVQKFVNAIRVELFTRGIFLFDYFHHLGCWNLKKRNNEEYDMVGLFVLRHDRTFFSADTYHFKTMTIDQLH